MTAHRRIKLLQAYRRVGLGLALAYQRLGSYRKTHWGVQE